MLDKQKKGEALFAEGRIAEAEQCFAELVKQNPRHLEAHNNLGVIAFRNHDIDKALKYFRKCLEIDHLYKDAVLNLVSLLRSLDHVDAAITIIKNFHKMTSPDEETLSALRELDGTDQRPASDELFKGAEMASPEHAPQPETDKTPWKSLWTQVKVEDILKEPSHQEIADNVISHVCVQDRSVLDVGCGSGGTGMSLAQYGAIMTLFDMSPDSLALSKKVFDHQGLKGNFIEGNMLSLPFPDNSFDIVTSFGVLEHFPATEIIQALKEMKRVAKDTIVTTVPNARCAFYLIAKWYAEKTGTWQYGYEKPEYSMNSYFQAAEINLYKEYSIGFIDSVAFLGRLPNVGPLQQISLDFNREHPNALDGSLIISFGNKYTAGKDSKLPSPAQQADPPPREFSPLVSVLMCAWNAGQYIAETMQSIINQTYQNFELIIADDGSTDNTRDVIATFNDSRIKYHYKEHGGLADSRNFARTKAKGDFLVIVDSDDLIAPSLLEKEIRIFEENTDDSLVVYPHLAFMRPNGEKQGNGWAYRDYSREEIIPVLFRTGRNVVPEASMMIPRHLLEKVGAYNPLLRDSDNEFIARLACHTAKFICLKEPLYFYRRHDGNMSSGSVAERAHSSLAMLEKMLDIYTERELFPDINWETMDREAKASLFHLKIAEVLWEQCKNYPTGGGFEKFLKKTGFHLKAALMADPSNHGVIALANEIVSLFPETAQELDSTSQGKEKAAVAVSLETDSSKRQPLKILYLADCRSQHTKRYVRFFRDRGHEVHIFDTSRHTDGLQDIQLHFPPPLDGNAPANKFEDVFIHNVFELNKLLEEIKPDLLHGHYLTGWCWWGAFTGFQPYVTTAWGSDIFLDTHHDSNRRLTTFCLKESPLVTADSLDLLEAAGKLRSDKEGLEYIPFGIDVELFRPGYDISTLAGKLGLAGRKAVLSPRQFKQESNIDIIIKSIPRVVARVPDTVFLLKTYLTDGSPFAEYQASLRELVQKLRVQDHVKFIEDMDFAEMPVLYNLTDVMVTLRDTDGSACSMLECMACKTPIVASDIESMREWITDGENGRLVDRHSPDAVADAIVELLLDREKKKKVVDASYQRVHERADYRKNWADVEALYYRLKAADKHDRYRGQGLSGTDRTARYEALNAGWNLLRSHEPDQAEKVFLQISGIDKQPMHFYLKIFLGLAKAAWMKRDYDAAREHYQGCLKLLQCFELDSHLDITR